MRSLTNIPTLVCMFFSILYPVCLGQSKLKPLDQVFHIQRGGTDDGSCTQGQLDMIETWWQECYDVLTHALTAIDDLRAGRKKNKYLLILLYVFFDGRFSATLQPEPTFIDRIYWQLYSAVNVTEGGPGMHLARMQDTLFCDSLWLKEVELDQATLDRYHLRSDQYYYWTPKFQRLFARSARERALQDSNRRRHFCNSVPERPNFGQTVELYFGSALTLCPAVWTSDHLAFNTISDALASSGVKRPGRLLEKTMPRMSKLLHELFHFANTNRRTPDNGFGFLSVIDNRRNRPWVRPETYVYFAWAFYLSTKVQPAMDWSRGISDRAPKIKIPGTPKIELEPEPVPEPEPKNKFCWPLCGRRGDSVMLSG